ncbi:MAG TPA: response regulator [Terriglobales bacterium]
MEFRSSILYVDDNPKARRLLSAILEQGGYHVVSAETPSEAIALAHSAEFDVALLDYGLPTMTGAQLAQELKCTSHNIPVVLISGAQWLPRQELMYVDAYCGSGSTLDELMETIQSLLVAREARLGGAAQAFHVDAD